MSEKTTIGYVALGWLILVAVVILGGVVYGAFVNTMARWALLWSTTVIVTIVAFAKVLEEWF